LVLFTLAIALLCTSSAAAQVFIYLAFGDSITEGKRDGQELGGYPGRLKNDADLLNCTPTTCDVINKGKGGETTAGGVTRIDTVLAQGTYDVMLLMEGTNDVFRPTPISTSTIKFNLGVMADKAGAKGVETVHASIIWFHPNGKHGTTRNDEVQALKNAVQDLANEKQRSFVNAWSVLCPNGNDVHGHNQATCFALHYFSGVPDPDPVGHPNASGYDMLADEFYAVITTVPAPGAPSPTAPTGVVSGPVSQLEWARESPDVRATWYHLIVERGATTVLNTWLPATWICGPSSCTYNLTSPLTPGDYTWRVRGRNPAGFGPWSDDATLRILLFGDGFESGNAAAWSRKTP
jgi:lysophospholipase L1-like esterase